MSSDKSPAPSGDDKPSLKERIIKSLDPRKDEVPLKVGIVAAIVELICTFIFVFYATASVIGATVLAGPNSVTFSLIIAFGQGLSLGLALFVASTVSGGHLNPAVTLAVFVVGRISLIRAFLYVVGQFAGAILASAILKAIMISKFEGNLGATTVNTNNITVAGAFFLEVIMTFTLVFVLFGTSLDPQSKVGRVAPILVGFVVLIDVLIGVQFTGASMNPARTLGPQLVSNSWDHYWLYFVAPLAGAIIAAVGYEFFLKVRPYEPPKRSKLSGNTKDVESA